jgi:transposase
MIALPSNVRVWLACGHTDMRRGFDGLASQVQQHLGHDPFNGQFFVFRGKRGDLIKILCWDGQGLCLFAKRLEKRSLHLAAGQGRRGVADAGATVDAIRRHRLGASGDRQETGGESPPR